MSYYDDWDDDDYDDDDDTWTDNRTEKEKEADRIIVEKEKKEFREKTKNWSLDYWNKYMEDKLGINKYGRW